MNPDLRSGPSMAEYADRLARVRAVMAERSISALVVTDPANLYYLTGYNAWSFYTPQCLVVPAEGDTRLLTRSMDASGATDTCMLPPDQIDGYPEALVHREDVHPFDWMAERAIATGALTISADAVVAVEGESHFFPVRGYQALLRALPGVEIIDSHELVNWVRVVKSPYEQALLRAAGKVSTQVMRTAVETITVGRRQCDAVADIMAAQAHGVDEFGGDYPAIVPLLPTGAKSGTPHLTWTDERFRDGEATALELAGVFRRYHAPLSRTIMVGNPPDRLVSVAEAITDAMAGTLEALRPGGTPLGAHAVFTETLARQGFTKESRIGYSIGIGYPPDWGEHTISIRGDDATPLQAGMAFHVILGMWMDGWGYVLSEPVLLTDSGAERLTNMPQKLIVRK